MNTYRLTNSQRNFYLNKIIEDVPLWNQGALVYFDKKYDSKLIHKAVNKMLLINESLRLRFIEINGEVFSYVHPFEEKKYSHLFFQSYETVEEETKKLINSPIFLNDELFRCVTFDVFDRSGMIVCAHHIITDGYSIQVLVKMIEKLLKNDEVSPFEVQSYYQFIENDQKYRSSKRFFRDSQYWKNHFSNDIPKMIFDSCNSSLNYDCINHTVYLPEQLMMNVVRYCNVNDISLVSFFCTALSAYISHKYQRERFCIGLPVLNRLSKYEYSAVGLYMHVLPLVIDLHNGSIEQIIHEIESEKMNLYRHEKYTQIDIINEINHNNSLSLFDLIFDYQISEENTSMEYNVIFSDAVSVPLEIHLENRSFSSFKMVVRYRKNMFHTKEIEEMIQFVMSFAKQMLKGSVQTYTETINELVQRNNYELYSRFNMTDYDHCIDDLDSLYSKFEENANRYPHHICISAGKECISYATFKRKVESLDAQIRKITNGEKTVVGIIAERSIEMYAGIYAAIRGGNAYLPIAFDCPEERVDFMIKDSEMKVLLIQSKYDTQKIDVPRIFIDSNNTENGSEECYPVKATADDTAYIIYTSGSTGKPKGAKVSHRSALNRILWMQKAYPLYENSVILQKTPYTFDVSVWEVFWWGICKGKMAFSRPNEHFLPVKILEEVKKNQVTHLHFVPSVFDVFLKYLENHRNRLEDFSSVRHVFLSGEALYSSLIHRFYALFSYSKVQLHNLYGPTECAIDVTYYDCKPKDEDPVPIGVPVDNTQMYIVDEMMNLVSRGTKGELCIAGMNVGQGYVNNRKMTNEKFVDNPFGEGKLYKTGDYAYLNYDNYLVFCGRIDGQIKINGQRVEISEIESVLKSIDGIESAIVLVEEKQGYHSLTAYYTGRKNNKEQIRRECQRLLPTYMVPHEFYYFESFPFNQNGKVDRSKLMELRKESKTIDFEEPQSYLEVQVCELFKKTLKTNEIGRNSNFFSFGGTSISMISLLSEELLQQISPSKFIESPTPASVAKLLVQMEAEHHFLVQCVYKGKNNAKALLYVPFAGGGAEAFAHLIKEVRELNPTIDQYYINYPHSIKECEAIVNEIKKQIENQELTIYSHCAGSAVAIKLIELLESAGMNSLRHYVAGGSIPPEAPNPVSIWKDVSNHQLLEIFSQAGANFEMFDENQIEKILTSFRKDTDFMTELFYQQKQKITCKTSVVISKDDIFTQNYIHARDLWEKYVVNLDEITFIESKTHYFQTECARQLASYLLSVVN